MSSVRLIRRPRSIGSHKGITSVLAVGYEDKMIAYVDKTGQLLPVGMYQGTSCCLLSMFEWCCNLSLQTCCQLLRPVLVP